MKFNEKTYYEQYEKLDQNSLSQTLIKSHDYVNRVTKNGSDWSAYHSNENHNRVINMYFKKLEEFIQKQLTPKEKNRTDQVDRKGNEGFSFSGKIAPTNLTQFKKALKENIGKTLYVKGEYKVKKGIQVRTMARKIATVQTNSFSATMNDGTEAWMDFGKASDWEFSETGAYYSDEHVTLRYYYKKPNGFKTGMEFKANPPLKSNKQFVQTDNFDQKKADQFFFSFLENQAKVITEMWVNPSIEAAKMLREVKKEMALLEDLAPRTNLKSFKSFVQKITTYYNQLVQWIDKHEDDHRKSEWSDYMNVYGYALDDMEAFISKSETQTGNTKKTTKPKRSKPNYANNESKSAKVERISDELKFIKRFVYLNNKAKTRNQIRLFISALQKAIRERRITKSSTYAEEIMNVQDLLLQLHERFKNDREKIEVEIDENLLNDFLSIVGLESEMASIKLIKSFINLQGKIIENRKAVLLLNRIDRAIRTNKVTKKDKYWEQINDIKSDLETFIKKNEGEGILKVEPQALNGLSGILSDCGCDMTKTVKNKPLRLDVEKLTKQYLASQKSLNGDEGFFMSSMELDNLEFEHVGLDGRWLQLIGDPAVGARIAVYGDPKIGKSYLMIEFAGDLAKSGKRVLYVTKEEGKSATLLKKFQETCSKHPNLFVTDYIPENIGEYDFVFFDSVSKCKLTPENLLAIKWAFPRTVKVEIHQVTKEGKARGFNDFIHDVDSIIRLPERGTAIQEGRYEEHSEIHWNVA